MSTHLTVTRTEKLTPRLTRLWFHSDDLTAFEGNDSSDRHVKLVFPKHGVDYPEPLDMRALRAVIAPEDMPAVRTYTALFPDVAAGTLAIDFVVHGDEGVAGPWAAAAQPGDTLIANGPGGGYRPDPGAELTFVHREAGGDLLETLRGLDWPRGRVHAFVHGEAGAVMHGLPPTCSASGAWLVSTCRSRVTGARAARRKAFATGSPSSPQPRAQPERAAYPKRFANHDVTRLPDRSGSRRTRRFANRIVQNEVARAA